MASKQFTLDEQTTVTIFKRRTSRNIRLSITGDGDVRVSIPVWVPYSAGLQFAKSRRKWIDEQRPTRRTLPESGQLIGKQHKLIVMAEPAAKRISSRTVKGTIYIRHPASVASDHQTVQAAIRRAAVRALKHEAESLLPPRLAHQAEQHGFTYKSVSVKQLKSRWGSCDQDKNIVFNLFLMQLPWDCIDYVILHELAHTRAMHHGPKFWAELEAVLPNAKQLRSVMRAYRPVVGGGPLQQT